MVLGPASISLAWKLLEMQISSSLPIPVEKEMATHSSTLAWKIPWTEEPGRLQSMGSQRVGHEWATSLHSLHTLSLEKEMATHSSILAWRIPWTEEPGGPWSMGSQRVRHDWSDWTRMHAPYLGFPGSSAVKNAGDLGDASSIPGLGRSPGGGNGNPLQYSCLENLMDRGALQATVHGVTKSRTQLSD